MLQLLQGEKTTGGLCETLGLREMVVRGSLANTYEVPQYGSIYDILITLEKDRLVKWKKGKSKGRGRPPTIWFVPLEKVPDALNELFKEQTTHEELEGVFSSEPFLGYLKKNRFSSLLDYLEIPSPHFNPHRYIESLTVTLYDILTCYLFFKPDTPKNIAGTLSKYDLPLVVKSVLTKEEILESLLEMYGDSIEKRKDGRYEFLIEPPFTHKDPAKQEGAERLLNAFYTFLRDNAQLKNQLGFVVRGNNMREKYPHIETFTQELLTQYWGVFRTFLMASYEARDLYGDYELFEGLLKEENLKVRKEEVEFRRNHALKRDEIYYELVESLVDVMRAMFGLKSLEDVKLDKLEKEYHNFDRLQFTQLATLIEKACFTPVDFESLADKQK